MKVARRKTDSVGNSAAGRRQLVLQQIREGDTESGSKLRGCPKTRISLSAFDSSHAGKVHVCPLGKFFLREPAFKADAPQVAGEEFERVHEARRPLVRASPVYG